MAGRGEASVAVALGQAEVDDLIALRSPTSTLLGLRSLW